MFKQWTYHDLLNNYLAFLVILSIVVPHLFGVATLPFVVLIVLAYRKGLFYFRISFIGLLFILLFSAYAIGMAFTFQDEFDMSILERKLSFLILPILLAFRWKEGTYSLPKLSSALIIGVTLAAAYGIMNSAFCYFESGNSSCWFTVTISPIHHPSYFMTFLITALFLAWFGWHRGWKKYNLTWIIPFTLFILIFHVLSMSLAGLLFMLLAAMFTFMYLLYRRFGIRSTLVALAVLPLLAYLFVTRVPNVEGEWNNAKWYADEYLKNPEEFIRNAPPSASGSAQRLILWTVGWQQFRENPWGIGAGNLDETLSTRLEKYGQADLAEKNMNPHNQYLQTGIEIGIVGLVLLFSILFYGLWLAFKHRNGLLLLLISCLAFNSLFESMLQRQSGVVFFTFWICLVAIHITEHKYLKSVKQ